MESANKALLSRGIYCVVIYDLAIPGNLRNSFFGMTTKFRRSFKNSFSILLSIILSFPIRLFSDINIECLYQLIISNIPVNFIICKFEAMFLKKTNLNGSPHIKILPILHIFPLTCFSPHEVSRINADVKIRCLPLVVNV